MSRLLSSSAWKLHAATLTFLTALTVFSILLCIKIDSSFDPSYFVILVPWFVALVAVCAAVEVAITSSTRGTLDFAKNLTRLGAVTVVGLAAFASVLIALKLNDSLDTVWAIPFVPIWVALTIFAGVLVLLFPGMIDPTINLQRIAFLYILYLCTAILLSILVELHLDVDMPRNWSLSFLPIWIAAGLHILSILWFNPKTPNKSEQTTRPWRLELFVLNLILAFFVLLNVRADVGGIPASIVAIPFWGLLATAGVKEVVDYWTADSYLEL